VTQLARVAFAVLVASTFAAFFVAQRLKNAEPVIRELTADPVFSPNRDGRKDRARIAFALKQGDDVTLEVVDHAGEPVRRLLSGRYLPARTRLSVPWDGRDEQGHTVPDGLYRPRLTLRRQGRSVTVPRSFRKDTTPPHPIVLGIGPQKDRVARPELLPRKDGKPARVTFIAPGDQKKVIVFRTSPGPVDRVLATAVPHDARRWEWDGKLDGRRVRPGTYLAVVESRDVAGNIGTSVPLDRRGLPRLHYGESLPSRGGITVRYLAVQPPLVPTTAGRRVEVGIDARQEPWTATLRRIGGTTIRRYRGTRPVVGFTTPTGESAAYLLTVRSGTRKQVVPIPVRSAQRHRVLVVLPAMTWQGRNPVDDDGDGRPNLLDDGLGVRLGRPLAGDGLPAGFARQEALVLRALDVKRHRYDLTTDVELAGRAAPDLTRYRGVVLPGDARWLPADVLKRLRGFVRRGGTILSLGTDSLRRQVTLTPRARLAAPTAQAPADVFGSRIAPLQRGATGLTATDDALGLFDRTTGAFGGFTRFELTQSPGTQAQLASIAVTDQGARPVIVGLRLGRGVVLRTGLPELPQRLGHDGDVDGLMERAWTLLSR
jgi:hypothetical protein